MRSPNISFDVVTKGPVAIAGSVLSFLRISGIEAPTIVAVIMIAINENW